MNPLLQHGLVSIELVPKTLTIVDQNTGEEIEAQVWIKPLSAESAFESLRVNEGGTEAIRNSRIVYSVRNEDGSPMFELADIDGSRGQALSEQLSVDLAALIADVNQLGKKKPH